MLPILTLLYVFLRIGLFAVGGGYAMIPLMQEAMVQHDWMSAAEFLDILAISEMTPGPIAVNAATFVGYRVAGLAGAGAATIGVCLPGFMIMLMVARLAHRFREHLVHRTIMCLVRPVVCGLLLIAAARLGLAILQGPVPAAPPAATLAGIDWRAPLLFALTLLLSGRRAVHPLALVGGAAVAGILLYR